jgi:hypothetical protein
MVLTGSDGQLRFNGQLIGKVRQWSLSVSKDAIDDTSIGDVDRTYVEGMRSTTGSATIMYDPNNANAASLMNSIFQNGSASQSLSFVFNKALGTSFVCTGFITSVNQSVSVGDIQAVSVNFQVSGKPSGAF